MNAIKVVLTNSTKHIRKQTDRGQTPVVFTTSVRETDPVYSTAPGAQDYSSNYLSRQLLFAL